ncbi:MAG: hypothetical protein QOE82_2483 [Thermoanaerobaculia bacterium]|jgi:hypothetical protein|nr:hypothetical protein [Thermoanaerobaculia bacterium]
MADETKPEDPVTITSSTDDQNPLAALPREGGIASAAATGAVSALDGDALGLTGVTGPGAGESTAGKLGADAPVFGAVLKSIGFAVAESQKALDDGVITGITKLNDTKIKVVTQVVQELNEDGVPDPAKTTLITNELSVLNFFTPTFHEWKNVELCMDLTVGDFHREQGVQFHAEQESTSVGGGGSWGFGGWFNFSHASSEQTVDVDTRQDVSWSSGQVRVSALLGPRRTGKFPTPATMEIGPQIYVTQGAVSEQKADNVVTSRSVDVLIQVRKRDGSAMQKGVNITFESGGLLPSFLSPDGSATDDAGRVKVKLTRNLAGGAAGFAKFPLSAALGAKRQTFTVTL